MKARDIGGVAEDARNWERNALTASCRAEVGYFAANRLRAETRWIDALIALLQWAPPVEVRPKLRAPSPEALARGLVVGAVVRASDPVSEEQARWRSLVVGHDEGGDPIVQDDDTTGDDDSLFAAHAWNARGLTVVLPPPALDSWLLDADTLRDRFIDGTLPCGFAQIAAEARRLVELARGGAR